MAGDHPLGDRLAAHARGQASASEITSAIEAFVIDEFLKGDIAATQIERGAPLEDLVHDWSRDWSNVRPMTSFPCGVTVSLAICSGHRLCQPK
jgi:hypothetical protein